MFDVAEMEYDDSVFTLGYDGNQPMMIFHGPSGLETAIRFDGVVITTNKIYFYVEPRTGVSKRETGSMEAAEQVVSFIADAPNESEIEYVVEERH